MARPIEEYRSFPYHAGASAISRAAPEAVWEVVSRIGGENRYFALNGLWAAREWIDAALGGEGRIHTRPQGRPLRAGDRIDSWRVLVADAPQVLAMVFGMKAPGRGVLEFRIEPIPGGTRLTATAWWDPDGVAGRLYWQAMKPPHLVLFDRLASSILRQAEWRQQAQQPRQVAAAAPA